MRIIEACGLRSTPGRIGVPAWLMKTGLFSLVVTSLLFADGLPGEYLLSNKWRQAFSFHSPVENPAFMMEEPYTLVRGVSSLPFNNAASLHEVGLIIPLDLYNTAGFSLVAESGGVVNGVSFSGDSLIDAGSGENNNLFLLGSYALNPWGKFSGGLNVNVAYQGNFGDPIWGFGTDLGVSYRLMLSPVMGYHVIGLTYKSLFSFPHNNDSRIPVSSQLATQYHLSVYGSMFEFDYQFLISDLTASKTLFNAGQKSLDMDMRFGVGVTPVPYVKVGAFSSIDGLDRFGSLGFTLGFDLPQLNKGRGMSLLYQFSKDINSDLTGLQSIYFSAQFGPHREELFAQRMASFARISLSGLYNRAMEDYYKENYWDAYFAFSRLMVESPEFFKNDALSFYAGSCLENMDMRDAALKSYKLPEEKFPDSRFVNDANLGMMRIYYRDERFDDVQRQYQIIVGGSASELLRQEAAYYMGETELNRQNYMGAIKLFSMISDSHPEFVFAQHSSAITYHQLDHDKQKIIEHLRKAIDATNVSTAAQKEIVNRSLVLMGYLYYEDNLLAKAVTALRMVPEKSYYYEDALLGLGWSAVKAGQSKDCISSSEKLIAISKKTVIICEGKLIQAFGYIQEKQFEKAEDILQNASNELESYKLTSIYSDREIKFYDQQRSAYDTLASKVMANAGLLFPDDKTSSLHSKQLTIKGNIDSSLHLSDEQRRIRFFEKSISKLKEDLEYALATVQRIRASVDIQSERKREKKELELDEEIENLREQMKKNSKE